MNNQFEQSCESQMQAKCDQEWMCPSVPVTIKPLWWWFAGTWIFEPSMCFLSPHSSSIFIMLIALVVNWALLGFLKASDM